MGEIESFLKYKRVAMVGVSRDEKHLSRHMMKAFVERDYDVLPVNPHTDRLDGLKAYPALSEIDDSPEAVMVLLSGQKAEDSVIEAIESGAKAVWVYGMRGSKDVAPGVLERLQSSGVEFVAGFCPFMFLENAGGIHKFHGWIWKVLGMMPEKEKA
jgi:predicted CoA-binding protein